MSPASEPAAEPPRRTPRRRTLVGGLVGTALLLTALVVAGVVLLGRGGSTPDAAPQPSDASSSPPADLTGLTVPRQPFCGRLDRSAVREALAAPVSRATSYAPGDRAVLARGLRDVADEFDCSFTAASGAQARVWVFAEPVRLAAARRLGRARGPGCRLLRGGTAFGRASAVTVCPSSKPAGRSVALQGLFGDAWLTCRVTGTAPRAAVLGRAQRWCAAVVTSLGG